MKEEEYDLDDSLGFLLGRSYRALTNRLSRNLVQAGYDVTMEQVILLKLLSDCEGIKQQDLSEKIGKDKTTTSRIIDTMEKRNLIERRQSASDRRDRLIYMTDTGRSLKRELMAIAMDTLAEAQEGITSKKLEICKEVLGKVCLNLK